MLKQNKWNIGDWVDVNIGSKEKRLLITGTYSDYMQMGQSGRMNPVIDMKEEMMADYWNILVDMKTDKTQKELAADLKKDFPQYEWDDAQSLVDQNVGGVPGLFGKASAAHDRHSLRHYHADHCPYGKAVYCKREGGDRHDEKCGVPQPEYPQVADPSYGLGGSGIYDSGSSPVSSEQPVYVKTYLCHYGG